MPKLAAPPAPAAKPQASPVDDGLPVSSGVRTVVSFLIFFHLFALFVAVVGNPPASQLFLLVGTVFLLPLILGYTAFVYWMFRGKIRPGEGYH